MKLKLVIAFAFLIIFIASANGADLSLAPSTTSDVSSLSQYYNPDFQSVYTSAQISTYWPILGKEECTARQDFILTIPPGGCQPAVVRSDLLEEQNVPVFCQIDAIKVNPFIDVEAINSIAFKGQYPKEVAGVGFHPAKVALRSYNTLQGSPIMNNVGYLVVVLKRQANEKNMAESVAGNLTAVLRYNVQNAFGIGKAEFLLPVIPENEWANTFQEYGFWKGKGFLRANWIENDKASVSIYYDSSHKESTFTLEKGKTVEDIYLSGLYCSAALVLRLKDIVIPQKKAKVLVRNELDGSEETLWLYENGKFLDNKCSVTQINPISLGGGSATIKCRNKEFTLSLGLANSVSLKVDNQPREIKLGEIVKEHNGTISLQYVGQVPKSLERDDAKRTFVVLVKSNNIIDDSKKADIERRIKVILDTKSRSEKDINKFKTNAANELKTSLSNIIDGVDAEILFYGESGSSKSDLSGITFLGAAGAEDYKPSDTQSKTAMDVLDNYFTTAITEYKKVVQLYPAEKDSKGEFIGEQALSEAASLAGDLGKQKTKQELLRDIVKNYPGTSTANNSEQELSKILMYNEEEAIETLDFGEGYYTFYLQDITEPTQEEASATISVQSAGEPDTQNTYAEGDYIIAPSDEALANGTQTEFVQLEKLDSQFVTLKYNSKQTINGRTTFTGTKTEQVNLRSLKSLGRFNVYVSDIKLQKIANIAVEPKVHGPEAETELSFHIGIEKRAIKLSPEKTAEKIQNLNESIKKWEDITNKLGEVIKGWKGVCYATSAALLVKNLVSGFSGESIARQKVMRGEGSWINRCNDMVAKGEGGYANLDDCLRKNNDAIEKEVKAATSTINNVNEMMRQGEVVTKETMFGEKILDTEKSFNGYMSNFKSASGSDVITKDGKTMNDLIGDYSTAYKQGLYTFSDVRDWKYYDDMSKNPDISEETKQAYKNKLSEIYESVEGKRKAASAVSNYVIDPSIGGGVEAVEGSGKKVVTTNIVDLGQKEFNSFGSAEGVSNPISTAGEKKSYIRIYTPSNLVVKDVTPENKYAGKVLLVPLSRVNDEYRVSGDKAYILDVQSGKETLEGEVPPEDLTKVMDKLNVAGFVRIDKGKCKNPYKNPEVKFYETDPYKGMPAVVPFDVKEGWYVGTKQIVKGFGLTPYTDAGTLKNFYLCNVGPNGREEFDSGIGDDICTFVSLETGGDIRHPCLTEAEAKTKATQARSAVMEAARQYANGVKKITIAGQEYKVGMPMGGAEGTQCQDFMSPNDCYMLFNACDPVLCPSSRCNLGGSYYVKDVVQSGIIGSIALCLPNAKEGIVAPVCLTGVHAGLESYVSILKAHRDCLQESLTTGKNVGICDEIESIYLCEFFWKQFSPLMQMALPKLVEMAYGKGTRGGGEYMTITSAWNNLDKSIDYFTNYYGQNAFKAFNIRSTEDVGSEVCKSFISARYPSNKKFFDNLLAPDSPVQYSAWFSEIPFTEATLPATSHYKVYYHIWAGNDQGSQYSIYLKDPPEGSFYASSPRIIVDTGFAAKGSYVDQTKDFTAPAGYKTLCVRVNLYEECGFGQVSTSFAIDYLKEQYVKEQATQIITSEKDCTSGTPSLYSLAQPNLEQGVQSAVNPEMYKQGIIRICSTANPGQQVDPTRWKDVGYCDNTKLRCWLDTWSVEANIQNNATLAQVNKAVDDISTSQLNQLVESGQILDENQSESMLDFVRQYAGNPDYEKKIILESSIDPDGFAKSIMNQFEANKNDGLTLLKILDTIEEKALLNSQKAEAIFLRGQIYDFITRRIKEQFKKTTPSASPSVNVSTPPTTTTTTASTKTLAEQAAETPENFIYKTYSSSTGVYVFYQYNSLWQQAISKNESVPTSNWRTYTLYLNKSASEGLTELKKTYSDLSYIAKS